MVETTVVILGAGLAGLRVAEGLRGAGFAGRVILVGEESHPPYDRPPLSKAVLEAAGHDHAIALASPDTFESLNIELRLGARAVRIDRQDRRLDLAGGDAIAYDRLVLATGSRVRPLPVLPPGAPGVHYLRDLDDAVRLREALVPGRRVAIVGGGVIGLEVAASARRRGCEVTVIEAADRLMARTASPTISQFFARRHQEEGVELRLRATVVEVDRSAGDAMRLRLSDGGVLTADLAVVGIGVIANIDLAQDCGLDISHGGVAVDGDGATSDPCIWAAGEVATHFNAFHGRRQRQETWNHAAVHGEHVGRALVAPSEGYAEPPSYWSDQYDINLQVLGDPSGEMDVVRCDPQTGRFLVFHLSGGDVAGVSAVNSARDLRAARRLIGRPQPADLKALSDPAIVLTSLL
jgi:NADPH-dependent 2,4-dienoyl-CoA reductase/sulfur reductase-like enzyme